MRLPPFQYLAPRTTGEAVEMMGRYKGQLKVVAGGTDIMSRLRKRLVCPSYVMSLKGLAGLSAIKRKKGEIVIGAAATLREIRESAEIRGLFTAVAQAADVAAAPPIRNAATLGGNLLQDTRCLFYNQSELVRKAAPACLKQGGGVCAAVKGGRTCMSVYQGDMASALIAFDARAVLEKQGASRIVPVLDLFSGRGVRPLSIGDDELLTRVILSAPRGACASSYRKLRQRSAIDYPLVSSAVFISVSKKGVIDAARVVMGAVGPAPVPVEKAAEVLVGARPEEADAEKAAGFAPRLAKCVDNLALPGAYRKKMAKVFVRRAIEGALSDLAKGGA